MSLTPTHLPNRQSRLSRAEGSDPSPCGCLHYAALVSLASFEVVSPPLPAGTLPTTPSSLLGPAARMCVALCYISEIPLCIKFCLCAIIALEYVYTQFSLSFVRSKLLIQQHFLIKFNSNPKILHGSITLILLELNNPGIVICVRYEILRLESSIELDCGLKILKCCIQQMFFTCF